MTPNCADEEEGRRVVGLLVLGNKGLEDFVGANDDGVGCGGRVGSRVLVGDEGLQLVGFIVVIGDSVGTLVVGTGLG